MLLSNSSTRVVHSGRQRDDAERPRRALGEGVLSPGAPSSATAVARPVLEDRQYTSRARQDEGLRLASRLAPLVDKGALHPIGKDSDFSAREYYKNQLVGSLRALGRDDAAKRVTACHHWFKVYIHQESGEQRVIARSCHNRLCPHCERTRARRELRFYDAAIRAMRHPLHIMLTLPSVPEFTPELYTRWVRWVRRLRSRRWWRRAIAGGLMHFETSYNGETGEFHPHFHILADARFGGRPVDKDLLHREWKSISGMWVTHVGRAHNAREIIKYHYKPSKNNSFLGVPSKVASYLDTFRNRHLTIGFGSFRNWHDDPDLPDRLDEDPGWIYVGEVSVHRIFTDGFGALYYIPRPPPDGWLRDGARWRRARSGE